MAMVIGMKLAQCLKIILLGVALSTHVVAQSAEPLPGKGIKVQPLKSSIAEETFQTMLVMKGLERLGYDVQPIRDIEYEGAHQAVGKGEGTFLADHWDPLHVDFFNNSGGEEKIFRQGIYSGGAYQGYLIDKSTADKHNITHISQLQDQKIARLFDQNGDGKADLVGCNKGWGCEKVIEHHLDAYGIRSTVSHSQGGYSELIAAAIDRFNTGKPVLYYTWTPYWISGVLVPGRDVVWLQVPFSSLPGARSDVDTRLPNGSNYGFQANNQRIIANRKWVDANPAAAKLFSIMELSNNDISAQNLLMHNGENRNEDIEHHTRAWIESNRKTFEGWISQALKAAR